MAEVGPTSQDSSSHPTPYSCGSCKGNQVLTQYGNGFTLKIKRQQETALLFYLGKNEIKNCKVYTHFFKLNF